MKKAKWYGDAFLAKVEQVSNDATEETAYRVMERARRFLDRKTEGSGSLAASMTVQTSKFKNGGHVVYAHGDLDYRPKNKPAWEKGRFYALFVEFGTSKMRAVPFLRPALRGQGKHLLKAFNRHYRKRIRAQRIRGG